MGQSVVAFSLGIDLTAKLELGIVTRRRRRVAVLALKTISPSI